MQQTDPTADSSSARRWRPISAIDRRVIGVLIEKAKTTPDAYPLSINALRSGMNQKNNRYPLMEVEVEDVDEALERLRGMGAVTEVQGGGRVSRYRHHMYEWLGAEKVELAIMAELLLRGAQTEGELRGRAARMDPIPDLAALRPILDALEAKGLIQSLTPKGRGHVLTHALYEPRELEKVRAEFGAQAALAAAAAPGHVAQPAPSRPPAPSAPHAAPAAAPSERAPASPTTFRAESTTPPAAAPAAPAQADTRVREQLAEFGEELEQLRDDVSRLRREMDELLAQLR